MPTFIIKFMQNINAVGTHKNRRLNRTHGHVKFSVRKKLHEQQAQNHHTFTLGGVMIIRVVMYKSCLINIIK